MTRLLLALIGLVARLIPAPHDRLRDELLATITRMAGDAGGDGCLASARVLGRELLALTGEVRRLRAASALERGGIGARVAALRLAAVTATRHWRQRPVVTGATLATLALTVATAVVTYGVARSVLWRPLPFHDADRLVFLWERDPAAEASAPFRITSARFDEWRRTTGIFDDLALFGAAGAALDTPEGRQPIRGVRVTASFFRTLGVAPALGRTFAPQDAEPGRPRVVVLSHTAWRQRFGGRADIVGRELRLGGEPFTVVGVLPDVALPGWPSNPAVVSLRADQREYFVPIDATSQLAANARSHVFGAVARLTKGVTPAIARERLAALASAGADPHTGTVTPLREQFVADARRPLVVLLAAALAVLLVASLNLAALRVAQHELRRHDLAVRAALGASQGRLVGDQVVEALLVTLVGGGLGVAGAMVGLSYAPALLPSSVPFVTSTQLDASGVLAVLAGLVVVAVVLAAGPVARMLRPLPRGTRAATRYRVYRGLVAAQVATSVALAVPAALLDRTLRTLEQVDPGFTVDDVVTMDVGLDGAGAQDIARVAALDTALHAALAGRRGVAAAALAYDHPLEANWTDAVTLVGDATRDGLETGAELRIVSPSYFPTLDVAILDGRAFGDEDDLSRPGAALVNQAFAATMTGRVLGRTLLSGSTASWGAAAPRAFTVVGVVENERFRGLDRPAAPAVYLSTRQFPQASASLLVRVVPDSPPAAADLRLLVRAAAPDATVGPTRRLADIRDEQLAMRAATAGLVGILAGLVVALAAIGLYGLMSVVVTARATDIGVRMAIGASRARVAGAVAGEGLACAAAGLLVGLGAASATGAAVRSLLVGASGAEAGISAAVGAVLLGVSAAAVAAPAVRATRIDPVRVLRGVDAGLPPARPPG